jgi:hypothetical protein
MSKKQMVLFLFGIMIGHAAYDIAKSFLYQQMKQNTNGIIDHERR